MKQILIVLSAVFCSLGSHLSILQPGELKMEFLDTQNKIENNLASFGYIPYGTYLLGRAYYQKDNADGCNQFGAFDTRGDPDDIFTPIFVVNRGQCPFVQKARRAQFAGAKLLIIIDNIIQPVNSILLSDDGTGRDITIPSMLVHKNTGASLLKYLEKDQNKSENWVTLKAVFDTWQSSKVEYDIYFSGSQLYFYEFLHDMKDFHKLLETTEVRPHFRVHSYSEGALPQKLDCYGDGKYCLFTDIEATGRQVLNEYLRQICILNRNQDYNPDETRIYDSKTWFNYVAQFYNQECDNQDQNCSHRAMHNVGINSSEVQKCVERTVVVTDMLTKQQTIPYFDHQIKSWNETWNTVMYPAITINRMYYKGNLIAEEVFRMICASYVEQPKGCTDYYRPRPPQQPPAQQTGLTVGAIIAIIILILLINVVVICCYRRYAKRDEQDRLKTEVNSAVSAYFALNEQEK